MRNIIIILLVLIAVGVVAAAAVFYEPNKIDYSEAIRVCMERGGTYDAVNNLCLFGTDSSDPTPTVTVSPTATVRPTITTIPTSTSSPQIELIRVNYPSVNEIISSPLTVIGEARGNWYFEASFPLELADASGRIVATGYAQALGEWMTTDFVPFTGTLSYKGVVSGTKGILTLRKDNPSGLPENDDSIQIPVVFK